MSSEFWKGKRVFLTGHTGFKGGWLALWLKRLGAEVTGYALAAPTHPSLYEVARVSDGLISIIADIRDAASLRTAIVNAQPEIVIHMAAQPLVRYSYTNPVETFATNVMGTVHLMEAVRAVPGIRAVVNVTSDKCYANREWIWGYRENDPMGGYDPYSSSKGCAELVTAAYRSSFLNPEKFSDHRVALATARAGNVIGGGDWADDRLIPDIIRAITGGDEVVIRSPDAIRPWQHVLEPLSGYLLLAEKLYQQGASYAEAWNFGPDEADAKPVQWVVDTLVRHWGEGVKYRVDGSAANLHEANYLKLDCSKARAQLDWQPRWAVAQAIEQICVWHKAYLAGADMQALCLKQIDEYESARN